MDGMEDKLGQILSNPQAMQQIMALAQSLGGSQEAVAPQNQPPATPRQTQTSIPAFAGADSDALLKMLFDFSKSTQGDERQLALFQALKPFLRPERAAKIDRALQAARISRIASAALERFAPNLFSGR